MNIKHLSILAVATIVWSVSPVGAAGSKSPKSQSIQSQSGTTFKAAKKNKGKGGTKGGEPFLTVTLENVMVSSYRRSPGGRPKGPPGAGLLGNTGGGNFAPNAPSPMGTPSAPASRGGVVIR
jgi:hypothetical protein